VVFGSGRRRFDDDVGLFVSMQELGRLMDSHLEPPSFSF
jgi:hypothetical protein